MEPIFIFVFLDGDNGKIENRKGTYKNLEKNLNKLR